MLTVFSSIVAVAGTLLGSCLTYLFQRRAAQRASDETRSEQRRQGLAEAELCRAEFDRGKRRIDNASDASREEARQVTYRLRAETLSAYYLLRLLADLDAERRIINAAEAVLKASRSISVGTTSAAETQRGSQHATESIEEFVDVANRRLHGH